jgi:lipid II:glycine glycyltransferase (peptidoglycan interpeptide bridge formation enzyme)
VVEGRRFGVRDRLVFFPGEDDIAALIEDLSVLSVLRIRQTEVALRHPAIFSSGVFRTACIHLARDDDDLLAGMSKTSRNEIRSVERLGDRVDVRIEGNELAGDFLSLYRAFVRAKGHTHPLSARRLSEYLTVSDLWIAYLDGQPACGHLFLRDDDAGRARFLYEGTLRFTDPAMAKMNSRLNRYLHWKALGYYRDHGFSFYDWGGIGDGTGPIAQFKLSMGGEPRLDRCYSLAGSLGRQAYRVFAHFR